MKAIRLKEEDPVYPPPISDLFLNQVSRSNENLNRICYIQLRRWGRSAREI